MKTKILGFVIATLFVHCYTSAQSIEKLITKDGFVHLGYICEQVPGENIVFYSDRIEYNLDTLKKIDITNEFIVPLNSISENLRRYAQKETFNNNYVRLICLEIEGETHNNLLQISSNRFVSAYPQLSRIEWSEIKAIERLPEYYNLYNIKDVLVLKNGDRCEGEIKLQVPDEEVVFLSEGDTKTIRITDILTTSIETKSDDLKNITKNTTFLDRIQVDDKLVDGIIISRTFNDKLKLLKSSDGETEEYNISDIVSYKKVLNTSK